MFSMLHVADLGLKNLPYGGINPETGLNRRFEDVRNNFHFVVSEAIKRKVKYFVIAGDINEERNPDSLLIETFSGFVADLISQGIIVIVVAGNHDVDSAKGTSTSISYLKSLGLVNTYIADREVERFEFEDAVFHCIPTMYHSSLNLKTNEELTNFLDKHINDIKLHPEKADILVSHYSLETTFAGLGVDEAVLKIDSLSKFDYVALGHIHKYEMFSSFCGGYTGSLFVKDFGESFEKFFNVVGFDAENSARISKVSVPERRFLQFDVKVPEKDENICTSEELLEHVKNEVKDIKDAIVKVRVFTKKRVDPKPIYKWLRDEGAFHYVPIEWKITRDYVASKLQVVDGMSDVDIVKNYLDEKEVDDKTKEKVVTYVGQVTTKWDQLEAE